MELRSDADAPSEKPLHLAQSWDVAPLLRAASLEGAEAFRGGQA